MFSSWKSASFKPIQETPQKSKSKHRQLCTPSHSASSNSNKPTQFTSPRGRHCRGGPPRGDVRLRLGLELAESEPSSAEKTEVLHTHDSLNTMKTSVTILWPVSLAVARVQKVCHSICSNLKVLAVSFRSVCCKFFGPDRKMLLHGRSLQRGHCHLQNSAGEPSVQQPHCNSCSDKDKHVKQELLLLQNCQPSRSRPPFLMGAHNKNKL